MSSPSTQEVAFKTYTPRVAIVTGGAQGIGYAIVHRLADDGFDVAINDISGKQELMDKVVEEIRMKGRRSIAVPGDVSSEADVASIVGKTVEELGGVDVMVANAGVVVASSFLTTSLADFDRTYAINARGVFLCFKYAAAQMVKQKRGGRLIGACSAAGKQGTEGSTSYSASKFATRGISQCAGLELRRYGITVNTYAPGAIRTPMTAGLLAEVDLRMAFGEPEDIASIVSYIAKPESYFLNGQSITVDGGTMRFD